MIFPKKATILVFITQRKRVFFMRNLFNMDNPLFRTLGKLADLMILNICFLICCIPIVTIGAALTGMSYVTLKMAEGEEGYIVKSFFKSFKENFRQSTIIWLIMLVIGIVLGLDFLILKEATGTMVTALRVGISIASFLYLMIMIYLFAVLARFYNSIKATIKNAFIMAIADFPRTLIMLVITAASVIVTFLTAQTLVYGMLVWLMFGFALVAYCNCFFLKKVFAKYMPADEDEDKDPDAWTLDEGEGELDETAAENEIEENAENILEDKETEQGE